MPAPRIFKLDGYELTALPVLARIYKFVAGEGRSIILPADIESIALTVRRLSTANGAFGDISETEVTVPIDPTIFDSLQTDDAWLMDLIGYNFAHTIPADSFPGMGAYSCVYIFSPASPDIAIFPFVIRVNSVSLQGVG